MAGRSTGQGGFKRSGGGFPLWAMVLIVVGIVLLLNNFGLLPWGVWGTLWRFWPVIIILIGVNIIWGRSHPWLVSGLSLLAILVVLGIGIGISLAQGGTQTTTSSFSEPRAGLTNAEVQIEYGAGSLVLDSRLADPANLAEGLAEHTGWGQEGGIVKEFERRNSVGVLKLTQEEASWFFSGGDRSDDWRIHLTPDVPMELTVKTGASDSRLDLSNLRVTRLSVDTGASRLSVTLPEAAGLTVASIKAGAADIDVTVPQGLAARISTQTGLSSVEIDEKRFPRVGDYYQSPNYSSATNRVDLRIETGVASVRVR